jgi:hypothetical protein
MNYERTSSYSAAARSTLWRDWYRKFSKVHRYWMRWRSSPSISAPSVSCTAHSDFASWTGRRTPSENTRAFLRELGYQAEIMNLWDEGLRKAESLVVIPATRAERLALARLFADRRGHAVFYFGVGHVESSSAP